MNPAMARGPSSPYEEEEPAGRRSPGSHALTLPAPRPMPAPRYRSTRSDARPVPLADALLAGLAPDGGLFVPDCVPPLPGGWRGAPSFPALAETALAPWLDGEIDGWREAVRDALDFPVPLVPLRGAGWEDVSVLELFHGPTLSFKDFGARVMARLVARVLPEGERLTVLVATSGDTGSAVADGFAGIDGVRVALLYPEGGVSEVQERQLVAPRPNVTALRVAGTFDSCQRLVKEAFASRFADARFAGARPGGLRLSSANSINVGRLLPQTLYYLEALRQSGSDAPPVFVVPSGNLGNLTAGVLAHLGGMPAARFVAAHNANAFFPGHLAGDPGAPGASVATRSNAMDVGAPSNFERLTHLLNPVALRRLVWGTSVSDAETLAAMRSVYDATGYVACPHTAVGLEATRRYRAACGADGPVVVLATAHPAKFPDTVRDALGFAPEEPEPLARLRASPGVSAAIPPTLDALAIALGAG